MDHLASEEANLIKTAAEFNLLTGIRGLHY